ncbi:exodeoxyribonuclease 7 small subunit [Holospora obtusa F1]|uniref:Exodeoxyribonuclease 7 small subunit n=1 Tax=Holospora obtusa F1 TaxID=1399147 RepID=W6TU99_HOLOB|nr:exodeoxyribonuclease VII small subunit [Holospora obtusa]ETZ07322.1 exodeoxyribonuclease 7 small subunit [Holospora obtusa F1]
MSNCQDPLIVSLSFESAMKQLEEIVRKFESGGLTLEESVVAYERGTKLRKHCDELLKHAKLRMEQVNRNVEEDTSVHSIALDSEDTSNHS